MRARVSRKWRRALSVGAGLFVLIALAHLPLARPLLVKLSGRGGGCPFGYDKALSPAQAKASLAAYAAQHRGAEPALARPALGFDLGKETRAEVSAWASTRGMHCKADRSGTLTCDSEAGLSLPSPAGLSTTALWFRFSPEGTLVSVTAVRNTSDASAVVAGFDAERDAVAHAAGPVTRQQGQADPQVLAAGALRQASAEFRYRDYYALLRATNLGRHYVLTEEFHALVE